MSTTIKTEPGVITLSTNRIPRPLMDWCDLTAAQREEVAHYFAPVIDEATGTPYQPTALDPDPYEARWFVYRGSVYDLSEFESAHGYRGDRGPDWILAAGFNEWQTESAFSAVLVSHFDRDGYEYDGAVVVGYAHW